MIRSHKKIRKVVKPMVASLSALLAGVGLLLWVANSGHAAELYAVESGSTRIHVIDLATGEATLISPISVVDIAGIAFDSSGLLHGITHSPNEAVLYPIDFLTGTASLVDPIAIASPEGALTFHPDTGVLYSKGGRPGNGDGFDQH